MAVPQVCLKVYETPSGCRGIPQCLLSTQTFQIRVSGWQGVAEIPLFSVFWFIPELLGFSRHSGPFGFCCLYSKEACGLVFPQRLCFSCAVCPLCLSSLLLAQSLDRK